MIDEVIGKIKEKASQYAKTHATEVAKKYYILGKHDAAAIFLAMIRDNGISAIEDVAKEVLKHNPKHEHAKWILENDSWKNSGN
jgi:hypothetical protein